MLDVVKMALAEGPVGPLLVELVALAYGARAPAKALPLELMEVEVVSGSEVCVVLGSSRCWRSLKVLLRRLGLDHSWMSNPGLAGRR